MSADPSATGVAAFEILSQCLAGRTHKLARAIDGIYNEELRRTGLRNTQLTILAVLAYMGEASVGELVPILVAEKSTLSRNLRVMEASGWVESVAAEGRGRRVRLTTAGKRKLRDALPVWRTAQERARRALPKSAPAAIREIGDAVGHIPGACEDE